MLDTDGCCIVEEEDGVKYIKLANGQLIPIIDPFIDTEDVSEGVLH